MGVQRLVCAMCPIHSDSEQQLINERNPDLVRDFDGLLRRWKDKLNLPEEWVTRRMWRTTRAQSSAMTGANTWSNVARIAALLAHVRFAEVIKSDAGSATDVDSWITHGLIESPISLPALRKYLSVTLGDAPEERDGAIHSGDALVRLTEPSVVTVTSQSKESARKMASRVSELINVYINCIGCGFCVDKCGCLVVVDGRVQASDGARGECRKCQSFMDVCPVNRSRYVNFSHLFSGFRKSSGSPANRKR